VPNGCESKHEDMRKGREQLEQLLLCTHDLLFLFVLEEEDGGPLRLVYSFFGSVVILKKRGDYERATWT